MQRPPHFTHFSLEDYAPGVTLEIRAGHDNLLFHSRNLFGKQNRVPSLTESLKTNFK